LSSDAVYSTRAAGTWTLHVVATMSGQVDCGNLVSNTGFVVGLDPAFRYDSAGTPWFCYRDVHSGQNMTDYTASDVECWHGGTGECAKEGGNDHTAANAGSGAHLRVVLVDDLPLLAYDHLMTQSGSGTNATVLQRTAAGWQAPQQALGEDGPGPGLAHDATEGVGVCGFNQGMAELDYTHRTDASSWSTADPVFATGLGGLAPDLAIDPVTHAPLVAFGICSPRAGTMLSACDAKELVLATRAAGWSQQSVVKELPQTLRLGILPSGRRMIAYRDSSSGALKVAISR
jgi:hypothetical protein